MSDQPVSLSDDDLDHVSGGVSRMTIDPMASTDKQSTDVLLAQIMASMQDAEQTSEKDKIKLDQETKQGQLEEKQAKLEEAAKKLDDAREKSSGGSSVEQKAMQWVGATLAIAIAKAQIENGVGLSDPGQFKVWFDTTTDNMVDQLEKADPKLAALVGGQLEKHEAQLMAQLFAALGQKDPSLAGGKTVASAFGGAGAVQKPRG